MRNNSLIGIDKTLLEIKEWIESWPSGKRVLLLTGSPGVGKTESVYVVAEKLNRGIVEFNASDERTSEFLNKLRIALASKSLTNSIYLLDEADYVDDKKGLLDILIRTNQPLIMTANEPWKLGRLRQACSEIRFFRPRMEDIIKNAEQLGVENKGDMIRDHRQAELRKFNSEGYDDKTMNERIDYMLRTGDYSGINFDRSYDYWRLIEESNKFYGRDLFLFVKALAVAQKIGRSEPLKGLKI